MKKSYITYKGVDYIVRQLDLSNTGFKGGVYENIRVSEQEMNDALREAWEKPCDSEEYKEAEEADCGIYFYMDKGFLTDDPTDTEIFWNVYQSEYWNTLDEKSEYMDTFYYNLMQMATDEIRTMYGEGRINVNCESYECGGTYSVYCYKDSIERTLYNGKDSKSAAMAAMGFLTAISISL